ncbi:hypothetical protein EVAR_25598_1 [Eumeta japonica]|uniref:Uncharacterized protein n=1 Tax=Eumeta variegata TaxID=151549 RepID=A0A4C1V0R3_EUMVA|nr:hypothetical protein EVAR_25598_1 [Eumeta japonica]
MRFLMDPQAPLYQICARRGRKRLRHVGLFLLNEMNLSGHPEHATRPFGDAVCGRRSGTAGAPSRVESGGAHALTRLPPAFGPPARSDLHLLGILSRADLSIN